MREAYATSLPIAFSVAFCEHYWRFTERTVRLLVHGRSTGSNEMPDIELVTAPRPRLAMVSYESVSKIREFVSIADLDIFAVGSQRERMCLDSATH